MSKLTVSAIALSTVMMCCGSALSGQTLPLEGVWRFALDPNDQGITERWFAEDLDTDDSIQLPGSLQEQGFGNKPSMHTEWTSDIGFQLLGDERFASYIQAEKFLSPFWLTPKRHYVGPAWYQRSVTIPQDWKDRRVVLHLERPHWQTTVWVNDTPVGTQNGLGTPHEYILTDVYSPGRHRLTIRVDNRVLIPVGNDAHSVSDQTQTNWNGIIGDIRLIAQNPAIWFEDVQVYPDVKARTIIISAALGARCSDTLEGTLRLRAESFNSAAVHRVPEQTVPLKLPPDKRRFEIEYAMGRDVQLWDEFIPALYRLTLTFAPKDQPEPIEHTVTFGMRQLGLDGTQFTINGRRIFLRGTLECAIFPKTGYPPMDTESWKRILRIIQAHGLNHLRFHSWCPPKAAFEAADEMGVFIQAEASTWPRFGQGTSVDTWIYEEGDRMLKAYGNHPSFILMAPANEPHPHGEARDTFLTHLIQTWSDQDSRRYYTGGSGWPAIPANEFHVMQYPRLQQYPTLRLSERPQTATDYRNHVNSYDVPVISHEIGQWCVYPNLAERFKYDGALRGGNIEIARDMLEKAGMLHLGHDFFMASGMFQVRLYKQEIEAALRTPGFGGFQLLDLRDFPGQGTAPVGVLDCFWEPKGYVSAEAFSRFCGPTVPLARMNRKTFCNSEMFEATVDVAHYGPTAINAEGFWIVRDQAGRIKVSGLLPQRTAPTGGLTTLGSIRLPLQRLKQPQKLILEFSLKGTDIANDWEFWVYPAQETAIAPTSVYQTGQLDEEAVAILKGGGTVLLVPSASRLKSDTLGTFRPIFWNRITFPAQKEHTMGILCDPRHPAFAAFPTDFHSNWQWWELLDHSKPIVLNDVGVNIEPLVRVIDDWNVCRSLGLIFEPAVDCGKLLVCSMDIDNDLENRLVARQLRRSLLDYMDSADFRPATKLSVEAVNSLFREPTLLEKLNAKVIYTSSDQSGYDGQKAIDGDPATMWHTRWSPQAAPHPHEIQIELSRPVTITGLTVLPRQDGNSNGRIAEYEVYVSTDAAAWGPPATRGRFDNNELRKIVGIETPRKGRFIRLVSMSGFENDPHTSAAELNIMTD